MLKDGIETIPGKTNPHVLLIAPHGYPDALSAGTLVNTTPVNIYAPIAMPMILKLR